MRGNWLQRGELLLGKEKQKKLKESHLLIVGVGGVGSWAAEMLCRAGVGTFTIVDADVVDITNINRQMTIPMAAASAWSCMPTRCTAPTRR